MSIRLRAEDEPAKTRLDYWQHVAGNALVPYRFVSDGDSLRSQIHLAQIGPVTVLDFHTSALQGIRTPDLIRRSDMGLYKVDLGIRGRARYEQDDRQHLLAPGDFHLIDLSRPHHVAIDTAHEVSIAMFPRELLPIRDSDPRDLTTVRFSARDPYAALVASLGRELTRHLGAYEDARDTKIGTTFLDLLTLAVASRLDRVRAAPAETRREAMIARVHAFIDHHLADPDLSPATIAAAHHISVRTLHKLYQDQEDHTVTASIRRRRLERCRQDLLDPALGDRPVGAIGSRWGYRDPAAFSRAFRTAYGLPPGEYRAVHARAQPTSFRARPSAWKD